ncbi:MAG: HAMP domain-containing protein [Nitrospiraceae bacterium]|nr:HAMP domain-containing protein [Nitrospiraceae bacterium]
MKRSVAGKLTLLITCALVVVFGTAAWLNLQIQERATTRILRLNGAQVADLVARATREAMLHNDRTRIQATINTLASQRGIERIRIIEKGGQIAYSTDHAEIGTKLEPRSQECITCHEGGIAPGKMPSEAQARVLARRDGRILSITKTIRNEPDCANASCHVHKRGNRLLGVLDVNMALGPYDRARRASAAELLFASLFGIFLVVGITAAGVRRMVHRPVRNLIEQVQQIAAGDLSVRAPEVTDDEIGVLAHNFNRMARDLETARGELLEWAQTLEERVQQKTAELRHAQDQILQVEKMASLGKLAAVVAHEINNPLSSVVTYAKILVRRLRTHELTDECKENLEYLESIASEATRCGEIVSQLLAFSRRRGGEFGPTDINRVVEKSLFLVHHKLELNNVDAVTELASDLPTIIADSAQIQQALMALLINAAQALEEGGTVRLTTRRSEDGGVVLEVADDGPGMPPEVAAHAFEPFFTTKEEGSGVGLGLSVVFGIVQRHGGNIDLDTAPGKGCRFILTFPPKPPQADGEMTS